MRRREFLGLVALLTELTPVLAQQAPTPKVGVLSVGTISSSGHLVDAFTKALSGMGYVEGRNIIIERRYALGRLDRLPSLASELVNLKVDVLFAPTGSAAIAARQASATIPIVFALVTDPVGEGFVSSLSRPGGMMTGMSNMAVDLAAKRMELLDEAGINARKVGVLYLSAYPGVSLQLDELQRAASGFAKELLPIEVSHPEAFVPAFARMAAWGAGAAIVIENPFFFAIRNKILSLALDSKLPVMANSREYVQSGALISYGANYSDMYSRAAAYVDRILNGARPGDLPVQQPIAFELVINAKSAEALGLALPPILLARADDIIE